MTLLVSSPVIGKQATGLSTNLDDGLSWPNPTNAVRISGLTTSHVVDTQPIEEPAIPKPAAMSMGPNDTFYNRILIEPPRLEMGNLLSDQTREISIWNGFLSKKTLDSVQRFNDTGIAFSQPVEAPYVMNAIEELTYTLSISTDGPAAIDAEYIWSVAGVEYSARVIGRRVVVFPFGPNWKTPVTETLEWMTDVIRAYDGTEQRRSLRTKARRSFSYRSMVSRIESARLENLLWGWQNRTYAVPVWTDKGRLSSEQLQGARSLDLATEHYSFSQGGMAILFNDATDYEVVEIESVSSSRLMLKRPVERNWPKGAVVYPCVLGHLPTQVSTLRHTSNALSLTVSFTCSPVDTDPFTPEAEAPASYEGREVVLRQPNWATGLENVFDYQFNTLDKQTGGIQWDTSAEWPNITRKYSWLLKNRQQILDYRKMLGRLRGRSKTLYIPTWHDDFLITQDIGASDTGIRVRSNEFRLMVGLDPARDRLTVRLRDGQIFHRKIVGVSPADNGDTLITMDESLGTSARVDQVHMLHLLMRSRLATDRVDLTWRSDQVVTVDNTFTSVKE